MFKSGFVGLIGRPNVGKSTLLNCIMNEKLAIVSSTAQTTRNMIRGIYTTDDMQIIFVDTPGIHKPKHALGKFMTDLSISAFTDMDLIVMIIEADEVFGTGDKFILDRLRTVKKDVVLVINKIDKVTDEKIMNKINEVKSYFDFTEIIPVSALNNRNVDRFIEVIGRHLLNGPMFYDPKSKTDFSQTFLFREIIREKILYHTKEEIPHSVCVVIDHLELEENGKYRMLASIIVERDSQKGIIIGKQGSMIKQIGSEARSEIKKVLGVSVHLELLVKVEKNWRNNVNSLRKYGYDNQY